MSPPSDADSPANDEALLAAIQGELRALASASLRRERSGPTLQTTALVNEAWLRLASSERAACGRDAYLALAARAIRRILVDHARRRNALKRGAGQRPEELEADAAIAAASTAIDHLALHEALERLAAQDERQARVVELRFYGGLDVDEVARVIGISPRTVAGDWAIARAFLHAELDPDGAP